MKGALKITLKNALNPLSEEPPLEIEHQNLNEDRPMDGNASVQKQGQSISLLHEALKCHQEEL